MTHCLIGTDIHVEPFESVEELQRSWPRGGVILVEDDGSNITDLLEHMTNEGNWLPVIGFKEQPLTEAIVRAIHNGSLDYLAWPCTADDVRLAVRRAEAMSSPVGAFKLREARARGRVQRLTNREREVLAGVANGLSNRGIGARLEISPRTVEIHRANMLTKLGAVHTSEAIRVAIEASLVV